MICLVALENVEERAVEPFRLSVGLQVVDGYLHGLDAERRHGS